MKEFKFSKSLLSAYYVATLISFFVFQVAQDLIGRVAAWILSLLSSLNFKIQTDGPIWLVLFFVCLVITLLIRKFVVEKLDLFAKGEFEKSWQIWFFGMLVLGFFIYILNLSFPSQPMPREWWPKWFIRFLGGYKNSYPEEYVITVEEVNLWSIVPWIWHIGPIAFLYLSTFQKKS
jgi:hypothetical protein